MGRKDSRRKKAAVKRNGFSKRPEGVEAGGLSERVTARRARSENACTSRAHRAREARVSRGTANYYLIACITEYNNGPRLLKAAATTPGINEPWRDINSGLNTAYKTQ